MTPDRPDPAPDPAERPGTDPAAAGDRPAVAAINPEAGNHPVPDDPRELDACLRAADACWKRFPYYDARYGERGRRFAASDGAWLGILPEFAPAQVLKHVQWLGRVLSSRGMPTLLLQEHLEIMFDELVRAVPARCTRYEALVGAAEALRDERCLRVGDDDRRTLAEGFRAAVGAPWRDRIPDAADVIVAAVADELNGHQNALSSVRTWMTDPARFPPEWIEAVEALIERAYAVGQAGGARPPGHSGSS